jgi:fatty-acyl-CoA synthase
LIVSRLPRQQVISFLGALSAGIIPSILSYPSPKQTRESFRRMLSSVADASGAARCWADDEFVDVIGESASTGARVRDGCLISLGSKPSRAITDALFLQFSSGTTGTRKGIAVTSSMFASHAAAYGSIIGITDQDRVVSWLPLYHDMGLVAAFLLPLYYGAASVQQSPFAWLREPVSLLNLVEQFKGTLVWLPNFAYSLLATRVPEGAQPSLRSVRAFINCGEPVRQRSHEEFISRFRACGVDEAKLQACYAMAENTFAITQTTFGRPARVDRVDARAFHHDHVARACSMQAKDVLAFVSCGPPVASTEVRIGDGRERVLGEIEIRGTSLFENYLKAGERDEAPSDGWFNTGDLGYIADGELFVTGRKKDLIIHRGMNLYPLDIEEVIESLEFCRRGRVVVFGLFDEKDGTEQLVALIEADHSVDIDEVHEQVRQAVWQHMGLALHRVCVCDPGVLSKSTSGKLSRTENQRRFLAGEIEERRTSSDTRIVKAPRDDVELRLQEIWRKILGRDDVSVLDSVFFDLGADSISALHAAAEIERCFGIQMSTSTLLRHDTIQLQRRYLSLFESYGGMRGSVVELNARGSSPPLIFVHPAGGEVFPFLPLARGLPRTRPILGLESPERSTDAFFLPGTEEMARYYVEELVERVPDGPYHLCGWSFGGIVAFEMATELEARGHRVASLTLLDTAAPQGFFARTSSVVNAHVLRLALRAPLPPGLVRKLPPLRGFFRMSPIQQFMVGLYALDRGARVESNDLRRLLQVALPSVAVPPTEDIGSLTNEIFKHLDERATDTERRELLFGYDALASLRRARVKAKSMRMMTTYVPRRRYSGDVAIIRVRGNASVSGWQKFSRRPLTLLDVDIQNRDGLPRHWCFLDEPNVPQVANALRSILESAESRNPREFAR